jgi:hypothetical protein
MRCLASKWAPAATRRARSARREIGASRIQLQGREPTGFEQVAKYETSERAYLVEIERFKARVGGREELAPFTLRVTSIFRPEDQTWRVVHRHADPD